MPVGAKTGALEPAQGSLDQKSEFGSSAIEGKRTKLPVRPPLSPRRGRPPAGPPFIGLASHHHHAREWVIVERMLAEDLDAGLRDQMVVVDGRAGHADRADQFAVVDDR